MSGFKLSKLYIKNNKKIIFDVNFLNEEFNNQFCLYTTVVIGTNGVGKSYLLSLISEIFRALENKKKEKDVSLKYEQYKLCYYMGLDQYDIDVYKKKFKITKNGEKTTIHKIELPTKMLAVSFMINDKFVYKDDSKANIDDMYEYLGIRKTSNATWTNTIVKKVSDNLIKNVKKPGFYLKVGQILEFLNAEKRIGLIFEPSTKTLFTSKRISRNTIEKKIEKYIKDKDYRSDAIMKITQENIDEIYHFINDGLAQLDYTFIANKKSLKYTIELDEVNDNRIIQDYSVLQMLIDLKMINSPNIILFKNDEFDFVDASSGEKQFIFTMINIAAKIEQNSIVLIDEPELSFHPNWQMQYIKNIKEIFYDYSTCHFLFATHSHFLISDLEHKSSSVVIIENQNKEKSCRLINFSTYAWSAENVLYNIFNLRTTRNYYFEIELRRLTFLIKEKSRDKTELLELINKLKQYVFDKNDPLKIIISEAKQYYDNIEEN